MKLDDKVTCFQGKKETKSNFIKLPQVLCLQCPKFRNWSTIIISAEYRKTGTSVIQQICCRKILLLTKLNTTNKAGGKNRVGADSSRSMQLGNSSTNKKQRLVPWGRGQPRKQVSSGWRTDLLRGDQKHTNQNGTRSEAVNSGGSETCGELCKAVGMNAGWGRKTHCRQLFLMLMPH